ncbi:hypothetical protein HYS84_00565 [Candidatus Saccharibacteria bacterium]|nr:hypothetical protein [Candidatus Saccharibacteria bacterium]
MRSGLRRIQKYVKGVPQRKIVLMRQKPPRRSPDWSGLAGGGDAEA